MNGIAAVAQKATDRNNLEAVVHSVTSKVALDITPVP